MFKEFKDFAMQGNLIDMAVAFIMGAAFGKVTSGFIDGLIMPLVSTIIQADFGAWKTVLKAAEIGADGKEKAAEIALKYGEFISALINFLVVAFIMFLIVKAQNAAKAKKAADAPAAPPAQEVLLAEIRDLLKK
jgi:large conductance mechanosensitive channel